MPPAEAKADNPVSLARILDVPTIDEPTNKISNKGKAVQATRARRELTKKTKNRLYVKSDKERLNYEIEAFVFFKRLIAIAAFVFSNDSLQWQRLFDRTIIF